MPAIALLDAATLGKDLDLSALTRYGTLTAYAETVPEERASRVAQAHIIITNKVIIDDEVIARAPNLKLICVAATGMNNIDLAAAARRGIVVKNVSGYSTESVAQHTFALVLSLLHHVHYYDCYIKEGAYSTSKLFTHLEKPFWQLQGKTFGIIGLGQIGQRVATLAQAFGCHVTYSSPSGNAWHPYYPHRDLLSLLRECDILSIHSPLNAHTHKLITYAHFKEMQRHALVLNLGRGGIIVEEDLARALDDDLIAGAGLDVFATEPLEAVSPLLGIKNKHKLLLSPHIAWSSAEARQRLIEGICKNIGDIYPAINKGE